MIGLLFTPDSTTTFAIAEGEVVGTFWLRANQPALARTSGTRHTCSPAAKAKVLAAEWQSIPVRKQTTRIHRDASSILLLKPIPSRSTSGKRRLRDNGEYRYAIQHSQNGLTNAYIMYRKL